MSMAGTNCKFVVRNQAYAKPGVKCTPEEVAQRVPAQKEAQKRMGKRKATEKAQRLKEVDEIKEAGKLKAASTSRP